MRGWWQDLFFVITKRHEPIHCKYFRFGFVSKIFMLIIEVTYIYFFRIIVTSILIFSQILHLVSIFVSVSILSFPATTSPFFLSLLHNSDPNSAFPLQHQLSSSLGSLWQDQSGSSLARPSIYANLVDNQWRLHMEELSLSRT